MYETTWGWVNYDRIVVFGKNGFQEYDCWSIYSSICHLNHHYLGELHKWQIVERIMGIFAVILEQTNKHLQHFIFPYRHYTAMQQNIAS